MKRNNSSDHSSAPMSPSLDRTAGWRNAFMLMRIPYAIFLMPVYWFALSNVDKIEGWNAFWVFIIIHVFLYPSSIGFNSYFDRGTLKFGDLQDSTPISQELFGLILIFDIVAFAGAWLISPVFSAYVLVYTLISKAYSFNRSRLQQLPFIRTLVVALFLGGYTYMMVLAGFGISMDESHTMFSVITTVLIAGAYPLSQIYAHTQPIDEEEKPLTMKLGIRRTFVYASIMFLVGAALLFKQYLDLSRINDAFIVGFSLIPILIFFVRWMVLSWLDEDHVSHQNAMNMNVVTSFSLTLGFLLVVILHQHIP